MSVSLRTIATATLAFALAVGLVTQTSVAQPAYATATSAADAQAGDDGAPPEHTETPAEEVADATAQADDGTGANGAVNDEVETGTDPDPQRPSIPATPEAPNAPEVRAIAEDLEIDEEAGAKIKAADAASAFLAAAASPLVSGFKAGNIITDGNFYFGGAMSVSQIQSFLEQQVPRCTIGDPGRKSGANAIVDGKIVGIVGPHCLVNMRLDTSTQTSQFCKPYQGARGESAAEIIAKSSVACGISPKVLLVMIEKEQSLVGDSWPTVRQLNYATGANCPDSGPNNSANCDPKAKGFAVQVYKAAQLMRWYAANDGLNYRPNKVNKIKWHEKDTLKCGTSDVYIENLATASLYTYTPYRPNQAALNAGWGTGDKCSSYGNRNFYMFYKLWFGSTQVRFPDVDDRHKFYAEIEWMAKNGLTTGVKTSDSRVTLYKPKSKVTREAMAAFLYRLEKSNYKGPKVSPFKDVNPGDKFYNEIAWMYDTKLSTGIKQPTGKPIYAPKDNVSREAMAAFIYRLKDANYQAPTSSPFADMNQGDKFYREITWMHHTKLSTGVKQPSGKPKYLPKDRVTREAMAAFIYRLKH